MTRRCSNYHCRTSLDENLVECPHGLPFCEHCVWEETCSECVLEPMRQRLADIWETAADAPRPAWDPNSEWAGHWAEQRADERALPHADPRQDDRAADQYYERRMGA